MLTTEGRALATALTESNSTQTWFCRLRGSHLLPVRVSEASENSGIWKTLHTKMGQLLLLASSSTDEQFVHLRQSIVRYINEKVVARDAVSEPKESSTESSSPSSS